MSTWEKIWDLIKALAMVAFFGWLAVVIPGWALDSLVTDFAGYNGNPDNLRWPAFWVFAVIAGFAIYIRIQRGKEEQARKAEIAKLKEDLAAAQMRVMQFAFPADVDLDSHWVDPNTGHKSCPQCGGRGCDTCHNRGWATYAQAKLYLFPTVEEDAAS